MKFFLNLENCVHLNGNHKCETVTDVVIHVKNSISVLMLKGIKSLKNAKYEEVKIQEFLDETKVREQTKNARKKSKYQGFCLDLH